jgi:two-component system NtrC family response regulator
LGKTNRIDSPPDMLKDIIDEQTGLTQVVAQMRRLLGVPVNVLVQGESGSGKEVIARALHLMDPVRQRRPFIAVNCAALPENLLEAELFGYRKGSFSGAERDWPGLCRQADGGTLFLDEIGEMPLALQPKLLRVLQEKAVRSLGCVEEVAVNMRVVAATNQDLLEAMQAGRFRTDLYFRLSDVVLTVPPLRARRQDIAPMAHYFLKRYGREFNRPAVQGFSQDALAWLCAQEWRANNARELSRTVKRAVLFCDGTQIELSHLAVPAWQKSSTVREELGGFERDKLKGALERTGGNLSAAARLLGMKRSTFYDHAVRLGLHGDGAGQILNRL